MLSGSVFTFLFSLIIGYGAVLLLVFLVARALAIVTQLIVHYRWQRRSVVIAEYNPPMGLNAAELGYLFDRKFGDNELLATLVSMAQKGAVTIDTADADWLVTPVAAVAELDDVEQAVLFNLFEMSDASRRWSELSSHLSAHQPLQQNFEAAVLGTLASKGLVNSTGTSVTESLEQGTAISISLLVTVATVILPTYFINLNAQSSQLGNGFSQIDVLVVSLLLLPFYIMVWYLLYLYSNLVAYTYYHSAGLPIGATQLLRDDWREIAGYREYLMTTERDRHMNSAQLTDPIVPYLIALEALS